MCLQSFNNYKLERIVLSFLPRLNCVAEFAGETGSVQGINYPLTTCASHLHTNGLENKLATLVGTVPEWL